MILLVLAAFVFGGGGVRYGLANLTVQLAALAVMAVRRDGFIRFWREAPLALRVLIFASVALPVLQLIPLPEAFWTALPGRVLVLRAVEQAGAPVMLPFSVDPLRTLLALGALVTPLTVLFAGWALSHQRLVQLGWLVVGLAILTAVLGAVQLASASEGATLYGARAPGRILLGTFANRNSTGLFLTFALALALLLPAPSRHPAVAAVRVAIGALVLTAIVLTQSRTALALALLPILLGAARVVPSLIAASPRRAALTCFAALAVLAAGAGTVLFAAPERIAATLERFEARDDPRRFIWDDALYSAGRYWPLGAGIGTFDEVYQVDESLENLTVRRAGRAHNDYIELAIEAGVPGLALAAAWLLLIGWLCWRARGSSLRWAAWAGASFLLAIALQSITDYPLRNQTILALAAYALLLLTRIATGAPRGRA